MNVPPLTKPANRRELWIGIVIALGLAAGVSGPDMLAESSEAPAFADEISVRLTTFRVRVIDPRGEAIRDLGADDFRAEVGGETIPVASADWVAATPAAALDHDPRPLDATSAALRPPPRRVVFFVQSAMERLRLVGQRRLLQAFGRLLDSFGPGDEVAVVSYSSRFELRSDFTADMRQVREAVEVAALRFGAPANAQPATGGVSLVERWDPVAAARAADPETGLLLLAEMLDDLPGEKLVLYLGWGLGRFGASGVRWEPDFMPAIQAFRHGRVPVHAIDISDAKRHSLEVGLQALAWSTGGSYYRTMEFSPRVVRQVSANLEGYYLLAVDGDRLQAALDRHPGASLEVDVEGRGEVSGPPLPWH